MSTDTEGFTLLRSGYAYRGGPANSEPVHVFVFPHDEGADVSVHVGSATAQSKTPLSDEEIHPFIRAHMAMLGVDNIHMKWEPSKRPIKKTRPDQHQLRTVYYLQDEDGFIKIGIAKDVKNRLATLRTGTRQELVLLATHPGTVLDEKSLHRRFAHLRTRGEWFEPGPELTQHIRGIS